MKTLVGKTAPHKTYMLTQVLKEKRKEIKRVQECEMCKQTVD